MDHLQNLLETLKQAAAQGAGTLADSDIKFLVLLIAKVQKRLESATALNTLVQVQ